MSEFITVQVGQCGNQIGRAFWPLVLHEHGVLSTTKPNLRADQDEAFHSFFYSPTNASCHTLDDIRRHQVKARALLIDMENSVVERFHTSRLNFLFDRTCTVSNYPGSGNNWAVGHYVHGGEQKSNILEMLRSSVEKCDNLHGFINLFSLGGGTGSGLGTAVLGFLEDYYPKVPRIVCCVHPGGSNDVITCPYNTALSLSQLIQHATCVLPIDNKTLLEVCSGLEMKKEMKNWEPYRDMNSIIVKMLLHLTSGARFPGPFNLDVGDLSTNLVPFPGLHFLSSSFSPITFLKQEEIPIIKRQFEHLMNVCRPANKLMSIGPTKGTVYCSTLFGRGDISLTTMRSYAEKFRNNVKIVSWSDPGVKTSLCSVPSFDHSTSLLLLSNNSHMSKFFHQNLQEFDTLYKKKAHVHHYTKIDGFDDDFQTCREDIQKVIDSYKISCREIDVPFLKIAV